MISVKFLSQFIRVICQQINNKKHEIIIENELKEKELKIEK